MIHSSGSDDMLVQGIRVLKSSSMDEGANLINVGEQKEGDEGGKETATGQW